MCRFIFMGKISNLSLFFFLIIMSFSYKPYQYHSTHNLLSAHISLMYEEIYYSKDHNIMSSMFYRSMFAFNIITYIITISVYTILVLIYVYSRNWKYSSLKHFTITWFSHNFFSFVALSWHVIYSYLFNDIPNSACT